MFLSQTSTHFLSLSPRFNSLRLSFFKVAAALPQPPTRAPWASTSSSSSVPTAFAYPNRPSSPPPPPHSSSSSPSVAPGPAPHHPPTAPAAADDAIPPRWPLSSRRAIAARRGGSYCCPRSLEEVVPARKCIFTADDLARYNASETFSSYVLFLRFCAAAVRGVSCKRGVDGSGGSEESGGSGDGNGDGNGKGKSESERRRSNNNSPLPLSAGGRALADALERLERSIDDVPPAPAALRYGNPAFREWHARASAESAGLLLRVLKAAAAEAKEKEKMEEGAGAGAAEATTTTTPATTEPEEEQEQQEALLLEAEARALAPFLSDSLGNASRIDYGTGHETTFATLLYCLASAGALAESDAAAVVAVVFARYVRLCRKLQTTYWLEPAGSHGVWGLDDYCFLPFYWGAAQLDDREGCGGSGSGGSGSGRGSGGSGENSAPSLSVGGGDPTRDGAPSRPSGIRSDATLAEHGDAYLYLDAVRFVRTVKKGGPLSETSPMLCDIAATVPTWRRVAEGLLKMYRVEVCGKLPIMQHQLFCHLFPFPDRM